MPHDPHASAVRVLRAAVGRWCGIATWSVGADMAIWRREGCWVMTQLLHSGATFGYDIDRATARVILRGLLAEER